MFAPRRKGRSMLRPYKSWTGVGREDHGWAVASLR
jgi:hypothetical protein